jgi:hypothetical protein
MPPGLSEGGTPWVLEARGGPRTPFEDLGRALLKALPTVMANPYLTPLS